ncbi:ABC-type polysaccharide/polyol phosphate export system, permease component [Saccharomonospora marina XMU15]|uniref:ABC-type polysaccharide/polyol phosphate export system, permease component n=1 Tax=Saccharomonospora marina XMU15 TaxID=882083 RepID=H5X280_9PSEU|nr:ABC transporter permease [Saccharomonospora marina]EHR48676.1 ABC-type polysaccharide/polyol phosphate export system, permease component [Saccharomonospora marina XMU15]
MTSAPPTAGSRSWARAFADLREGFGQRELWGHLAWQDIKQRYRRSVLGPLWITLSMGITALGLGLLYSQLFDAAIGTFLPYITTGFIVWNFILGCLTEGTDTFISNEGLIKHLPAPLSVYVLRTVWRQSIMFAHNLIIYFIVIALFWNDVTTPDYSITAGGVPQPGLNWGVLLAIPAFALIAVNAGWVVLLFGISSTRFRDIPQVVASLINLLFFLTPIVWSTDILKDKFGESVGWRDLVAELNPLYHFIQILRAPLIGNQQSWHHWAVVAGFTVVGWALALLVMRNYRARVSYWV